MLRPGKINLIISKRNSVSFVEKIVPARHIGRERRGPRVHSSCAIIWWHLKWTHNEPCCQFVHNLSNLTTPTAKSLCTYIFYSLTQKKNSQIQNNLSYVYLLVIAAALNSDWFPPCQTSLLSQVPLINGTTIVYW